jgi:hypothetical protein
MRGRMLLARQSAPVTTSAVTGALCLSDLPALLGQVVR